MITPISNNLTAANSLSDIERPRVPRRNNANAVDSINFTGKSRLSTGKITTGIKKIFGGMIGGIKKGAGHIRNGVNNIIHSKAVQSVKNGAVKGFHSIIKTIKNTPKTISSFFGKIANKFSKKA